MPVASRSSRSRSSYSEWPCVMNASCFMRRSWQIAGASPVADEGGSRAASDDGPMDGALAFALTAALNPTLLTATMVMLFAAEPRRLMLGYLLGAYLVSIGLGVV